MIVNTHHLKTPVVIQTTFLDIDFEYRQKCIKEAYILGDSMNLTTNVKAIMSKYDIWNHTKIFNPLIDKILNTINEISPPVDFNFRYQLTEAWTAIYKKNHHSISHHHQPRQTSFVYYLQTSPKSSPLIFDNIDFSLSSLQDLLVFFPSYLYHNVPKQIEEEDRICFAGNLSWIEK
jgi:hypothetical protein